MEIEDFKYNSFIVRFNDEELAEFENRHIDPKKWIQDVIDEVLADEGI